MNLRIVFKFKDCKLQFCEKRRLVSYFSVNPCTPASHWRCLLKLKRKKTSFKIIIGFFFTPPLFLATKVAISFVYYSPKTIKCTQKPKIEKKFTGIDQSSERVPFSTSYLQLALAHARNSRVKNGNKMTFWAGSSSHFFPASAIANFHRKHRLTLFFVSLWAWE